MFNTNIYIPTQFGSLIHYYFTSSYLNLAFYHIGATVHYFFPCPETLLQLFLPAFYSYKVPWFGFYLIWNFIPSIVFSCSALVFLMLITRGVNLFGSNTFWGKTSIFLKTPDISSNLQAGLRIPVQGSSTNPQFWIEMDYAYLSAHSSTWFLPS